MVKSNIRIQLDKDSIQKFNYTDLNNTYLLKIIDWNKKNYFFKIINLTFNKNKKGKLNENIREH